MKGPTPRKMPAPFGADATQPDSEAAPAPIEPDGDVVATEQPGHYSLKRELGRGAQAIVYLALDQQLGREVAFKQLMPGGPRDAEKRFLREARVAGQLEHPGIVPVYEVGRRGDGSVYYAQRLVRGHTLAAALKDAATLRARLQLLTPFVQLCQAVAFAHQRGVIHRDLKPDNVMLGEFGETVVLDWGLAKLTGKDDLSGDKLRPPPTPGERFDGTQEGDVLGTPAYMSPEQALGNLDKVDEQSDVWSLGAVLYEILTGKPPFQEKNAVQLLIRIAKDKVSPARTLDENIPRELSLICERCLERNKARRYPKARDIAADLEAYRSGGRVSGVEYSPAQLVRRYVQRNLPVAIGALVALLLLAAAVVKIVLENREARGYLAEALLEKSDAAARAQEWSRASAYAAAARVQDDTAEARWRTAQRGPLEITPLWRAQLAGGVEQLALSPDGKIVAVALSDHAVHLLDAANSRSLRVLEAQDAPISALAFSADGQTLVTAAEDRSLIAWSVQAGEKVARLSNDARVRDAAFSPDGALLATANVEGFVRIFSTEDWSPAARLDGHEGAVTSVAFSADSNTLVSSGDDGTIRAWTPMGAEAKPRSRQVRGEGHQPVFRTSFAGGAIASASADGTVRFFSLEGQQLQRLNTNHGAIVSLAAGLKGPVVALGQDNVAFLIDSETRVQAAKLEGDDAASAVSVSADGTLLATANRDGRLRLWRIFLGPRELRLQAAKDFPGGTALAFAPAPRQAAVGDAAGHIMLWDLITQRTVGEMDLLQGPVSSLAYSPDGHLLAVAGHEDRAYLFDLKNNDRVNLEGHTDAVRAVAFSPDGAVLATGAADGTVRLWSAPKGTAGRTLTSTGMGAVNAVAFSPDGRQIAAAGDDKVIRIWDAGGKLLRKLEGSPEPVLSLAFSPHGSLLASSGMDQTIRLWRLSSGKLRSGFAGHGGRVFSVAFAPDGETLASASIDGTVRLWDVRTGRTVSVLDRPPEARAVAFSPDGKLLASTGPRPALQILELGDKAAELKPAAELERQLHSYKLRLEGITLSDDVEALAPREAKPSRRRR